MKAATYVSAGNLQLLDQKSNGCHCACLEDNHLWDRPSHPRRRCASL